MASYPDIEQAVADAARINHEQLVTYIDLRETVDDCKVNLLVDGTWVTGQLEAIGHCPDARLLGHVRWTSGSGQSCSEWFTEGQLKRAGQVVSVDLER